MKSNICPIIKHSCSAYLLNIISSNTPLNSSYNSFNNNNNNYNHNMLKDDNILDNFLFNSDNYNLIEENLFNVSSIYVYK